MNAWCIYILGRAIKSQRKQCRQQQIVHAESQGKEQSGLSLQVLAFCLWGRETGHITRTFGIDNRDTA